VSLRTLVLETSWGSLKVVGGSRAGEGTAVLLPQLRLALDAGRAHRALVPMNTVFISHGHMDHVGALGYWASQRYLNSMGTAHIVAPRAISSGVQRLLENFAELEGGHPYDVGIIDVESGDRVPLRPDMDLHFFETDHWVPTLGCRLVWRKHRLRAELAGLPGEEIARRRRSGQLVTEEARQDLATYCADSGPGLFATHPEVLRAEVVLLECSFFRPDDHDRAATYGHMHLDDLLGNAERLRCRHLILLHASRRHRLREVEAILEEQVRPTLDCELHHLMVDWE
jgi:ribonuclease Z